SQRWTFLACVVLRPRLTTASGMTASELPAVPEVRAGAATLTPAPISLPAATPICAERVASLGFSAAPAEEAAIATNALAIATTVAALHEKFLMILPLCRIASLVPFTGAMTRDR